MRSPPQTLHARMPRGDIAYRSVGSGPLNLLVGSDMSRRIALVTGSGLGFHDAGLRSLKDVPGEWPLYAPDG